MSITDELREYTEKQIKWLDMTKVHYRNLFAIADRIDAEHESKVGCTADEWDYWESTHVELPKDADGEYIHIGDKVTCAASVWEVTGLRFTGGFWGICCTIFNDKGGSGTNVYPPSDLHHYHAPTVEDVLCDFARLYDNIGGRENEDELWETLLAEYAAKLRLAGDAE